ncbi:MAG: hypothetical protein ICV78_24640, partial [Tolypothrix sp. Co-bin9]|nr:hypothetical protein [Tolypothrix sp. Co-bin9]
DLITGALAFIRVADNRNGFGFGQYLAQGVIIFFEVWHDLNILSDRFAHNTDLSQNPKVFFEC